MQFIIIVIAGYFICNIAFELFFSKIFRKLSINNKFAKEGINFSTIYPFLLKKGYLTQDSQTDIKFSKLDDEFKSWLPQYSEAQFNKIELILQQLKDAPNLGGYNFISFNRKEFRKGKAEVLIKAVKDCAVKFDLNPDASPIENLNSILTIPSLYDRLNKRFSSKDIDRYVYKKKLKWLIDATSGFRQNKIEELDEFQVYYIAALNRLVLELAFPGLCPTLLKKIIMEWVEAISIALLMAILIRSYFIQPFKIPSGSMRPTLLEDSTYNYFGHKIVIGDHIFVDKWNYGPQVLPPMFWDIGIQDGSPLLSVRWPEALLGLTKIRLPGLRKPQRGDIIVFVYPVDPTKDFIKRLIAVGGETVEIKDGAIYINGKISTDPHLKRYYYNRGDYGAEGQVVHVPPGYDFVMGDNSGSSYDSRFWGFVPEENIIGKADFIFFPFDRVRILQ